MRRLMVMALPLLLAIPVAAQEQDADDSTEIGSGMASYYGDRFAGNRTASGERFDPDELTAAHRTLAFGRPVRVTNLQPETPRVGKECVSTFKSWGSPSH